MTIKHFDGANPNLNPPASLLVFAPMSLFEPHATLQVVRWGSLIAFLAVLLTLNRIYRPPGGNWLVLWALSMPGFWGTIMLGQIYVVPLIGLLAAARGRLFFRHIQGYSRSPRLSLLQDDSRDLPARRKHPAGGQ